MIRGLVSTSYLKIRKILISFFFWELLKFFSAPVTNLSLLWSALPGLEASLSDKIVINNWSAFSLQKSEKVDLSVVVCWSIWNFINQPCTLGPKTAQLYTFIFLCDHVKFHWEFYFSDFIVILQHTSRCL